MNTDIQGIFAMRYGVAAPVISRRGFLAGAAALATFSCAFGVPSLAGAATPDPLRGGSMLDKLVPAIDPTLDLLNAHTNERIVVKFFTATGYDMDAVKQLNWVWRDWRQSEAPQVDVRLWWALAAIRGAAMKDGHTGETILLSGFRTLKTNNMLRSKGIGAASRSLHLKAQAVDFRLSGIPIADLSKFASWLQVGGTGRYNRSGFVHIDSGPERSWNG